MPGWLKKTFGHVTSAVDDFADDLVDKVSEHLDNFTDSDMLPVVSRLKKAGEVSNKLARETTDMCIQTQETSQQMMEFCTDLKETLTSFQTKGEGDGAGAVRADAFETIQDLLSGEKVQSAMFLAKEMSKSCVSCVTKSVEMVTIMEDLMDNLPDPLEKAIEKAMAQKGPPSSPTSRGGGPGTAPSGSPTELLTTLDRDMEDVQACITAISELNLFTALQVGLRAFEQFSLKAKVARDMFDSIRGYSKTVQDITDAMANFDLIYLVKKIKDMWKCLTLTALMKELAQGLGKLIQMVIGLFEATSTKVAGLWKALAFAKDCMMDCVEHAQKAKALVLDATEQSATLVERSLFIKDQLGEMGDLDKGSIAAFKELADGEEISTCLSIANNMDDLILDCTKTAVSMVSRVKEGFANLPPMVTEGIPDDAGKKEEDPDVPNVERSIVELEASQGAIEEANLFMAIKAGTRGFMDVSTNVGLSKQLLELVQEFASTCITTIESFLGVWDIQSAMEKIVQMSRIMNLGAMITEFANQIKRIILAVIALLKASIDKFKKIDVKDLANQAVKLVQNINLGDLKDDLTGHVGKIGNFFKR